MPVRNGRRRVSSLAVVAAAMATALAWGAARPATVVAQTTGSVLGVVRDASTNRALAGVDIRVDHLNLRTITGPDGRFVLAAVPAGYRTIRAEMIGYRVAVIERVNIRGGRQSELEIELAPSAVEIEGLTVDVSGIRLIEPEIVLSHAVVAGHELRELPVDAIEQAIELVPGVSGGHFRGGRIGQEVHVIDGLEFKNQLEASRQGSGLELSPTSLEEVDVVTGGFGAEYGSALSGVIRYVTRRGSPDRWEGRAALSTDHWAPESVFRGFSGLSLSAGGPLRFLGSGTTIFADLLAQGMYDAEPRARGLTCLEPADVDEELGALITQIRESYGAERLHCPYTGTILPHQQGDKLIGFVRFDRPLFRDITLTGTMLRNRFQRQLYTPAFKYNPAYQLGQRTIGSLATVALDWSHHREGRAYHLMARGSVSRIDRHLGTIDPWTFDGRSRVAGFGTADFRFLGEDFVRRPIEEQISAGTPVPGYLPPAGSTGSPFGPAAEGIFFTEGTPDIANWSRSDVAAADVLGEVFSADGHVVKAGGAAKFYRVESYERVLAHLPGSALYYVRFFPATYGGFVDVRLAASESVVFQIGGRIEAFRSGIGFREDRDDFLAPVIDTDWKVLLMPRIGAAFPWPGSDGRTSFRFNYGMVAQPPDFRYFLDTTIGDSLRTDIDRQGNPNLGFERGASYEVGVNQLLGENVGAGVTLFYKELNGLVSGSIDIDGGPAGQYSVADFGNVQGVELTLRAAWPIAQLRAGWSLQKAVGVMSGSDNDPSVPIDEASIEVPLAFDQRHAIDFAAFLGRAAGDDRRWGAALTGFVRSGYPLDRTMVGDEIVAGIGTLYLPWTAMLNLRGTFDFGAPPACSRCRWRAFADGRNILRRHNVIGLDRETGLPGPTLERIAELGDQIAGFEEPIPRESPRYSPLIDLDRDGIITAEEYRFARIAAALDRFDPSLFFGEAMQVRIGLEIAF